MSYSSKGIDFEQMPQSRKRIAILTHSVAGGVWTTTRFLATILDRAGCFAYDILTLSSSARDTASVRLLRPASWIAGPRVIPRNNDGLPVRHAGATLTEFEFQRYKPRPQLDEILKGYDIVQIVGGSPSWGQVAANIRRPLCVFAATTIAAERGSLLKASSLPLRIWRRQMTRFTTRAEERALAIADVVFAESNYTQDLLQGKTRPGALVLGPPGVDADFFAPASSRPDPGAIICVGRLQDPRKNIRLLLEAYGVLCRHFAPPPLFLVGRQGLSVTDMQYASQLGIADKIRVFADVSWPQLRDLYQASSLFVLPSNEEGLGIVILEAMASGLPVISTDCGGPSTAVLQGETGLLTPVGDVYAFADAMRALLENKELSLQMGAVGRRRIEQRFSIESAGQVYLDVYRKLLGMV